MTNVERSRTRSRLGLGALDQMASSLSNIITILAVARLSDVNTFGAVGVAFTFVTAGLAVLRGAFGTPMAVLSHAPADLRREARWAVVAALTFGGILGILIAIAGLQLGTFSVCLAFAVGLPAAYAQDMLRFYSLSAGNPGKALASDGAWLVGALAVLSLSATSIDIGAFEVGLTWSLSAYVSLVLLAWTTSIRPRLNGVWGWLQQTRASRLRYGSEGALGASSSLAIMAVAALIGTNAVAALRGVGTVFGPLNLALGALTAVAVPELNRRRQDHSGATMWARLRRIGWVFMAVSLSLGAVGLVLPEGAGMAALGQTWVITQPILLIAAVEYAGHGWVAVSATSMRAMGKSAELLRLRVTYTIMALLLAFAGSTLTGSVVGISVGLAVASVASALYGKTLLRD